MQRVPGSRLSLPAMAQQQQALAAASALGHSPMGLRAYHPYQLHPSFPVPPPPDESGLAIGLPVRGMMGLGMPDLFHRFQMPGVLNARPQRHGFSFSDALETQSKTSAVKQLLADAAGLNMWKKDTSAAKRESSSSTHTAFLLGARSPQQNLQP